MMRIIKQDFKRVGAAFKSIKQSVQPKKLKVSTDTKDTLIALGTMSLFPILGIIITITLFHNVIFGPIYAATISMGITLVILWIESVYWRSKGKQ